MKNKIDWKKLWNDFESWLNDEEDHPRCKTCNSASSSFPDWEEQQRKIQQLVNTQVREIAALITLPLT